MAPESDVLQPWEREFIEVERVARLGTLAADGRPHLVPVCFALDGNDVVIAVDEKPKRGGRLARLRNIERDPRATLLIDRYDHEDWTKLRWVRLECDARIVERGGEDAPALTLLRARYTQYAAMDLESLPLLRLRIRRVVIWHWQQV